MKTNSELQKRLYQLAEHLKLNPAQFSVRMGKDRTYLSNISKEIQTDALRNIYKAFPNVNIIWIVTGDGEMFISENNEAVSSKNELILYLKDQIKELEKVNKSLLIENVQLKQKYKM